MGKVTSMSDFKKGRAKRSGVAASPCTPPTQPTASPMPPASSKPKPATTSKEEVVSANPSQKELLENMERIRKEHWKRRWAEIQEEEKRQRRKKILEQIVLGALFAIAVYFVVDALFRSPVQLF